MGSRSDASGTRGESRGCRISTLTRVFQEARFTMGIFGDDKKKKDEKRPDFSNVQSGSSSTAPSGGFTATDRTYVVQKGDSLSKIAKEIYGNASDWRKIFDANRDRIEDPDLIQPGWKLTIPAA
jgi:nucleoid-associated protein YgaU